MKIKDSVNTITGELLVQVFKNGKLIQEQVVHNLVTALGFEHYADQLAATPTQSPISAMAIGTGSGQDASDTELATEVARVALSSRVKGSGGNATKVIYTATFPEGVGTGTITEAGLFNALSAGVMTSYSDTFTAVDKQSDVKIVITWSVNFTS